MKKIQKIIVESDGKLERLYIDETFNYFTPNFILVRKKVKEIIEHPAAGEGDKWYYDAIFEDNSIMRFFNIDTVYYDAIKIEGKEEDLPF